MSLEIRREDEHDVSIEDIPRKPVGYGDWSVADGLLSVEYLDRRSSGLANTGANQGTEHRTWAQIQLGIQALSGSPRRGQRRSTADGDSDSRLERCVHTPGDQRLYIRSGSARRWPAHRKADA